MVLAADVRAKQASESVNQVQEFVFKYLRSKVPNCPNDLFTRSSFDDDAAMLSSEVIETDTLKIWATRFNEPDRSVPGRSWATELLVAQVENGGVTFGSRLICSSRNLDFTFDPAVPRIYKDLVQNGLLFADGAKLSRWASDVSNEDEVDWLIALINSKRRSRDIIVLSCDQHGTCFLNPSLFSNRLSAVAHVVRIYPSASFLLSQKLGKYLSVFDTGVRVYKPTDQVEADEPARHPLYTKRRLQTIDHDRAQVAIASGAFRTSVESGVRKNAVPSFIQIRSEGARFKLSSLQKSLGRSDEITRLSTERDLAIAEKKAAEARAEEAWNFALQEDQARQNAQEERDQERGRAIAMSARIKILEERLNAPTPIICPDNYEDIPDWVGEAFAGRMTLAPRAVRGLRDARYEDPVLVCELLRLLGTKYVDGRRGDANAWREFSEELQQRGIQFSRSISETRAGEQGDEYFLVRRDRKQLLEWHLKKGTSRTREKDLRIYFLWDDEDEEVVVGWLPSHLDNRLT